MWGVIPTSLRRTKVRLTLIACELYDTPVPVINFGEPELTTLLGLEVLYA